ncbi:MAG: sodium:alanine symporter family protein [Bacteroidota bacterium]
MEHFLQTANGFLENILIVGLLGTGLWLTVRLGFIQFRRLGHGIDVVRGKYDDPNALGDVTHFQALTTALSATVGIGNIAGVAIAIHWGGPGAVFWMWVTALLGMATKFTEVTLAQKFRINTPTGVAGGPMYYIENGLGKKWKPIAAFFAMSLIVMGMISGNAVQANTLADLLETVFEIPGWLTGGISAAIVGLVIIGGISRIGKVTSILAPSMAALYVLGGLMVLFFNAGEIWPSLKLIFTEAFNPTAGVAGTGAGIFMQTLIWGVRRGLFSNEAGQGSAPIAHSAARTEEPVSEGVVALLEPFIDTIVICSITALVILTTGVWKQTTQTEIVLSSGDLAYRITTETGYETVAVLPDFIEIKDGEQVSLTQLSWHEVPVEKLYADAGKQTFFSGKIFPNENYALANQGERLEVLYADAVENAAPLTMWAYREVLGQVGMFIVVLCVVLFAISSAISWSYYGDRCTTYLFGGWAILPYRVIYVVMHFVGAILSLNVVWDMGDLAMAMGTIPNVLALLLLSGVARELAKKYFAEKPYERR